jgi:Uma2 family endonuclease
MLLTSEKRHTKEDYERLPEGAPYQLIGGELIMSPSPEYPHQGIVANILERLRPVVRSRGLGDLILSPMDVHLTEEDIFQPDLIFVRKENLARLRTDRRIYFVPDLVIEVLSPSTAYYDYSHKKQVYAERGVKEYWIVDPLDKTIEIMIHDGKVFQTEAILRFPALLESPMFPGFSMKIEEVFEL